MSRARDVASRDIVDGSITNADVNASAAIALSKLGQSGATTGQGIIWSGSTWAAGSVTSSQYGLFHKADANSVLFTKTGNGTAEGAIAHPDVETGTILGYVTGEFDAAGLEPWQYAEITAEDALAFSQGINPNAQIGPDGRFVFPLPEPIQ